MGNCCGVNSDDKIKEKQDKQDVKNDIKDIHEVKEEIPEKVKYKSETIEEATKEDTNTRDDGMTALCSAASNNGVCCQAQSQS